MALSKEEILEFWHKVGKRADFQARIFEGVAELVRDKQGIFEITTTKRTYLAASVVLSIGRSGTPRKLEIKGEDLPKVMYRLIEADAYTHKRILVVGGGDSAVEAAMGLANQKGNEVTLSYRRDCFSRLKERNAKRIDEYMKSGRIRVVFNSSPVEISEDSAVLDCDGILEKIPNDFVWVFAGGIAPDNFLRKIGVQFGSQPLALDRNSGDLSSTSA